jgi:hypothetical protein
VNILLSAEHPRLRFGAEKIINALKSIGIVPAVCVRDDIPRTGEILVCVRGASEAIKRMEEQETLLYHAGVPEGEAYQAETVAGGGIAVAGGNETGALYGCLYLAKRISEAGCVPDELLAYDAPSYELRGPCVGLQKTTVEPPRRTYEYPITPDRFGWFYDKPLWEKFLDMLLENRSNVLYLWSGHPFSSLQKLERFPEALEVTEEEYQKNHETFLWLARECDRRGIWLVVKFYNIHIPLPFAEVHGLSLVQDTIHPLVKEYTFEAIKRFVTEYPNVGLMVCLGEALRGADNKARWFAETIVPAVKAGAEEAGLNGEPPIILRGHDCDPEMALGMVEGGYQNLYTMWKYNGEGLTTRLPRGKWQQNHLNMHALGKKHIINVHILADLEPFRFISPEYIRQCVQASTHRLGGGGLHLYPLFYWDWPYSPDKADPRLLQMDRDRLWFEAWLRYAWNADRSEDAERLYWNKRMRDVYGISEKDASRLLEACALSGLCQTKFLARFGITEGNRQTVSLGMTMSQLTNAARYRPNGELYASVARAGETLEMYAQKEAAGESHTGETPPALTDMLERMAVGIEKTTGAIVPVNEECKRLIRDLSAIALFTKSMCEKVKAALKVLSYKYTCDQNCRGDLELLKQALMYMESSLSAYRKLTALTDETYLYANSMQTRQRKIPFPDGSLYGHWRDCLPEYEKETAAFRKNVALMEKGVFPKPPSPGDAVRYDEAPFEVLSGGEKYCFAPGESAFTDKDSPLELCASELSGLTGIRFGMGEAIVSGITLRLRLQEPARILIGYFDDKGVEWLSPPCLETDTHADDRGGYATLLTHAVKIKGVKSVNVHAFTYEAGEHTIRFATGAFIVAGVIPLSETVLPRDAGLDAESLNCMDWLYDENALSEE